MKQRTSRRYALMLLATSVACGSRSQMLGGQAAVEEAEGGSDGHGSSGGMLSVAGVPSQRAGSAGHMSGGEADATGAAGQATGGAVAVSGASFGGGLGLAGEIGVGGAGVAGDGIVLGGQGNAGGAAGDKGDAGNAGGEEPAVAMAKARAPVLAVRALVKRHGEARVARSPRHRQ